MATDWGDFDPDMFRVAVLERIKGLLDPDTGVGHGAPLEALVHAVEFGRLYSWPPDDDGCIQLALVSERTTVGLGSIPLAWLLRSDDEAS